MIEDVPDYEEEIREGLQDLVDDLADMEMIVKDIKKLIKKYYESLP